MLIATTLSRALSSRWLAPLLAAVVVLGLMYGMYNAGHKAGSDQVMVQWQDAQQESAAAAAAILQHYRLIEQQWADNNRRVTDELHAQLLASQAAADSTIADLRSGNVQLRQRFRSCSTTGVSDASTSGSGDDAAGGGGLSNADAEFLVRLAERADQAVSQLSACQAYVNTISQGRAAP